MERLKIEQEQLLQLMNGIKLVKQQIHALSSDYVSADLFMESKGASVEVVEQYLAVIRKIAVQLETFTDKVTIFLNDIIIGFNEADSGNAQEIKGGGSGK